MSKSYSLSLALPLYQGTSPARFLFLTYPLSFGPGLWRPSDHAHSQVPPTLGPNHLLPPYPARRLQTPHLLLVTQNARAPEWLHNEDKVGLGTWIGWAAEGSSPGPSTDLELPLDHPVPSLTFLPRCPPGLTTQRVLAAVARRTLGAWSPLLVGPLPLHIPPEGVRRMRRCWGEGVPTNPYPDPSYTT